MASPTCFPSLDTTATPALGIELAARDVDSGRRWPAHGSCAGERGMLFLGSRRPRPFPPRSFVVGSSRTGQFEFELEFDVVVVSCCVLSMRRA